jgi:hypothetical protein
MRRREAGCRGPIAGKLGISYCVRGFWLDFLGVFARVLIPPMARAREFVYR